PAGTSGGAAIRTVGLRAQFPEVTASPSARIIAMRCEEETVSPDHAARTLCEGSHVENEHQGHECRARDAATHDPRPDGDLRRRDGVAGDGRGRRPATAD